jgi:hypothetical protein
MLHGRMTEQYDLNSDNVMYTAKARAMYANTENGYKLGAGMIKPIINTDVSFIGEPIFKSEDQRTNDVLEMLNKNSEGFYSSAHLVSLREGDYYVWVQWDDKNKGPKWVGIPAEKLKQKIYDPVTTKVMMYVFEWQVNYLDAQLANQTMTITISITDMEISYKYSGQVPPGYVNETVPNVLREMPIVQLSNDKEDFETEGHSEITVIEPYIKAYHDVMLMALNAQKNNSAPKLKLKVKDIASFIDNNFGSGTFTSLKAGTEKLDLKQLDLVLLNQDDEADYMTVASTTTDAEPLLRILFYLIVEASETLELIFGAHLDTSRASTDNQLPVYSKKIERKQSAWTKSWLKVVELSMKFLNFANIDNLDDMIEVIWPQVDFATAEQKMTIFQQAMAGFSQALQGRVLSLEETHKELQKYVDAVDPVFADHIKGLSETSALLARFQEDSDSQFIEMEGNVLNADQ